MADGPAANVRLRHLVHEHGAHHAALHAALLDCVLHGDGIDNRGKHAHVIGAYPVHFLGLLSHAAEDVAASHNHANLHAQMMHIHNLVGNRGYLVGVQAKAARPGQYLTRKLQNNALVHAFSSIAYDPCNCIWPCETTAAAAPHLAISLCFSSMATVAALWNSCCQ